MKLDNEVAEMSDKFLKVAKEVKGNIKETNDAYYLRHIADAIDDVRHSAYLATPSRLRVGERGEEGDGSIGNGQCKLLNSLVHDLLAVALHLSEMAHEKEWKEEVEAWENDYK